MVAVDRKRPTQAENNIVNDYNFIDISPNTIHLFHPDCAIISIYKQYEVIYLILVCWCDYEWLWQICWFRHEVNMLYCLCFLFFLAQRVVIVKNTSTQVAFFFQCGHGDHYLLMVEGGTLKVNISL